MNKISLALLLSACAWPAVAQNRQLDAHEHGQSKVEIAIEGGQVSLTLMSPGMDIVGFEYRPETDADKDAVAAAIALLEVAENVVQFPEAAACRLSDVKVRLEIGEDTHGHDDHDKDHGDEAGHDDHDHDKEAGHDDHGDEAGHDDHDHDKEAGHDDHATHSAFEANYSFDCASPAALTTIVFPFFETFPRAEGLQAVYVNETGVGAAELDAKSNQMKVE